MREGSGLMFWCMLVCDLKIGCDGCGFGFLWEGYVYGVYVVVKI